MVLLLSSYLQRCCLLINNLVVTEVSEKNQQRVGVLEKVIGTIGMLWSSLLLFQTMDRMEVMVSWTHFLLARVYDAVFMIPRD